MKKDLRTNRIFKMSSLQALLGLLVFCGVSCSIGNSELEPAAVYTNIIPDSGEEIWFPSNISQDVLASFDKMETSMRNLVAPETHPRFRHKRSLCNSQALDLKVFDSVVDQTRELVYVQALTCNVDKEVDACTRAVQFIDCGVVYFRNAYRIAFAYQHSLDVNERLFNAYGDFADRSQILLNNDEIQCCNFNKRAVELLTEALHAPLNRTKNELTSFYMKHCIWEISMGRANDAASTFSRLTLNSTLTTIIQEAFNNHHGGKGHQNYEQILRFIEELKDCSQKEVGYGAFYNILKAGNDENSYEMLRFSESLKTSNCYGTTSLEEDVTFVALQMAWAWGAEARAYGRNVSAIYDFSMVHSDAFRLYLPELVKKAYNKNIRNAKNVLDFIGGLPNKRHQLIAYLTLYDEMKESDRFEGHEVLMVAYRTNKRGEDPGSATNEEIKRALNVKYDVPIGIRNLLWGRSVEIKSKAYDSANIGFADGIEDDGWKCTSSKWMVEVHEDGEYFRFSTLQGKSLTFASLYGDIILSAGDTHEHQWQITPVNNGSFFYLKNRATGTIIEADGLNKKGCVTAEGVGQDNWHTDRKFWSFQTVAAQELKDVSTNEGESEVAGKDDEDNEENANWEWVNEFEHSEEEETEHKSDEKQSEEGSREANNEEEFSAEKYMQEKGSDEEELFAWF